MSPRTRIRTNDNGRTHTVQITGPEGERQEHYVSRLACGSAFDAWTQAQEGDLEGAVRNMHDHRMDLEAEETRLIMFAREHGLPWRVIANLTGMSTASAASHRYTVTMPARQDRHRSS